MLRSAQNSPWRAATALLALAGPALAGGTVYTSAADGNWNTPATWDLAAVPGVGADDQAFVIGHDLVIDSAPPFISTVVVDDPGFIKGVTVQSGAVWTGGSMFLGNVSIGFLSVEGGSTAFSSAEVGFDGIGVLTITGGTVDIGSLSVGDSFFDPFAFGNFEVYGGSVTVDSLTLGDQSVTRFRPPANGLAGLQPIQVTNVLLEAGSSVDVFPTYPALVGDSWDLIESSGSLTGTFTEVNAPLGMAMAIDTSTPGVVRAVVTQSPYPLAGNTCDNPLPAVIGDNNGTFSLATNTGPGTVCGVPDNIGVDLWFEVSNPGVTDLCLEGLVLQSNGVNGIPGAGLERWDACGGVVVQCDQAPDDTNLVPATISWVVPAGGTTLLRVTWGGIGGLPYKLHIQETNWKDLGGGTVGANGQPTLDGDGTLVGGTPASITLTNAPPNAPMLAWISLASAPFPAIGGTVHAFPFINQLFFSADGAGTFAAGTTWPLGIPPGTQVWFQFVIEDLTSIHGLTLSNGLLATTP